MPSDQKRAYLLRFSMQNGTPFVEMHVTRDSLFAVYNGHPQGQQITNQTDLDALMKKYQGQQWVLDLLSTINPATLEE